MDRQNRAVYPPDDRLLTVENLVVAIQPSRHRPALTVIDSATVDVGPGEIVGIVGESGSGKTMLCRALLGTLSRRGATVVSGSIRLRGRELVSASESSWSRIRGREIGYVPQSALSGPNPVLTIEKQLVESIRVRGDISKRESRHRARELLDMVQIDRPDVVLKQFPSELSGGMRQRVMIAAALAQSPSVLVADEPTTGLDVTVQAEIMKVLGELSREFNTGTLLVSHDLALIEDVCDRVMVMHAGATVEIGSVSDVMGATAHPYTDALRRSRIDLAAPGTSLSTIPGEPPSVGLWPSGCRFAARCELATEECAVGSHPELRLYEGHRTACLHAEHVSSSSADRQGA